LGPIERGCTRAVERGACLYAARSLMGLVWCVEPPSVLSSGDSEESAEERLPPPRLISSRSLFCDNMSHLAPRA
jgi:hypothetical protein